MNALAPNKAAGVSPIHIRKPDIEKDHIEMLIADDLQSAGAIIGGDGVEFFMERELIQQGALHVWIIFDD
jgi:hypothetical protein